MGTPNIVLFSPIACSTDELVDRLAGDFADLEIEFEDLGRLEIDEEGDLAFSGEIGEYQSVDQIKSHIRQLGRLALSAIVYVATGRLYTYIWHDQDRLCLSMEIPQTLAYHQSDDYAEGEYLVKLLVRISSSLSVDLCVYGQDYTADLFSPAPERQILDKLRDGSLFDMAYPNVHIISFNLVDQNEMKRVLERHADKKHFQYHHVVSGYHVLSVL